MQGFRIRCAVALVAALAALIGCAAGGGERDGAAAAGGRFSIAMIPDTQNMVDYKHQKANGFPFDAREMFLQQLRWVADHTQPRGGEIAFVTSVGDNWQHQSLAIDPEHAARGFELLENPFLAGEIGPRAETRSVEMPAVKAGWELVAATGVPFGVAPGNHDYDAMWSDARYRPVSDPRKIDMTRATLGLLHVGGLENFRQVFGADTPFFRGKPWYVASYAGGTSSAQTFTAGGYTFLHFSFEMSPVDAVLEWASQVIAEHPGLPTIVSTHDFLSAKGERKAVSIIDLAAADPAHNGAEDMWREFLSRHDQIFLVLCGHQHGQARRVDANARGHEVHQILADFQDRGQSALDAGVPPVRERGNAPVAIGDGWFRLMSFDTAAPVPRIEVRSYSAHYGAFSTELPGYAAWYKAHEDPQLGDAEFLGEDDFTLALPDFRARFGPPR